MKYGLLLAIVVASAWGVAGCGSSATSDADVNATAKGLADQAKGQPTFHDGGIVAGGAGGGTQTAVKPHR